MVYQSGQIFKKINCKVDNMLIQSIGLVWWVTVQQNIDLNLWYLIESKKVNLVNIIEEFESLSRIKMTTQ